MTGPGWLGLGLIVSMWLVNAAFCVWVLATVRRPGKVKCLNCGHWINVKQFNLHWKECEF